MDDKRIQELVRMAMEAEALERPPTRSGVVRRLFVNAGIGVAAAACLAVGFVVLQPSPPAKAPPSITERPADRSIGTEVAKVETTAEEDGCVVMAMFRAEDGSCSCVQVREPSWDGRRLADVSRSELRTAALKAPCSNDAEQVFIVAVQGRSDSLPRSHEQAEVIAKQVSRAAASVGRHADVSSLAYAAMPGLSPGATVVAESIAMRETPGVRQMLSGAALR
jgi:hypothetical protein